VISVSTAIFLTIYHGGQTAFVGAIRTVHFKSSYTI